MLSPRYVSVFRYLEFLDKFAFYPTKFSHYEYLFNDLSDHEFKQLIADVHDNIELAPIDRLISLKRNFQLFFLSLRTLFVDSLGFARNILLIISSDKKILSLPLFVLVLFAL